MTAKAGDTTRRYGAILAVTATGVGVRPLSSTSGPRLFAYGSERTADPAMLNGRSYGRTTSALALARLPRQMTSR